MLNIMKKQQSFPDEPVLMSSQTYLQIQGGV